MMGSVARFIFRRRGASGTGKGWHWTDIVTWIWLVGGLLTETTLLVAIGALAGLAAGYGLAAAVAPLLTMSPDGRTPSPEPWLVWAWGAQSSRTLGVVAAACAVTALVAALGVRRTSGAALRMGDDR